MQHRQQCLWGADGSTSCGGDGAATAAPVLPGAGTHASWREGFLDAEEVKIDREAVLTMSQSVNSSAANQPAPPRGPVHTYMGIPPSDMPKVHSSAQHPLAMPTEATVFQRCGYYGWNVPLSRGRYTLRALQQRGFVDKDMASVRVHNSGVKVTLYSNDNFTGASHVVTADAICLTGTPVAGKVSSIDVRSV